MFQQKSKFCTWVRTIQYIPLFMLSISGGTRPSWVFQPKRIAHIRSEITTSGSGHRSKKSLSGDRTFRKMGDNLSCCGHEAPGLQCVEVGWWHLDLFEKFGYVMSSYFFGRRKMRAITRRQLFGRKQGTNNIVSFQMIAVSGSLWDAANSYGSSLLSVDGPGMTK